MPATQRSPAFGPATRQLPACGAGSPLLFGATAQLASHSRGHNKRLALLPAGYDWATSTEQVSPL